MAEYYSSPVDFRLTIEGDYHNTLDIEGFSLMMKNPSFCYKFYWLEALVKLISEGVEETTFEAVIDEMIANAWYSVREFHIHLTGSVRGVYSDALENAVLLLGTLSGLASNASKTEVKNALHVHAEALKKWKLQLTNMVPYRALAGFFQRSEETPDWEKKQRMVEYIVRVNKEVVVLPYTLGTGSGLKKEIYFHPTWCRMIRDNTVAILGWIQYEKVKWLQMNNPEVPGLVYKLAPLDEKMRKLGNVRKLWKGVLELRPVEDVFTGRPLDEKNYDVDHFIPWSFVMNDELWNLMPMDSSLNSSKSNHLPKWEPFFPRFAENQYILYELLHTMPGIRKLYDGCYKDNLHSIWAEQELYRAGNSKEAFVKILEKNMSPVYDSARRQGYEVWRY